MLTNEQYLFILNSDETARTQLARLDEQKKLQNMYPEAYAKIRENIVLGAILRNPKLIDDMAERVYNEINNI